MNTTTPQENTKQTPKEKTIPQLESDVLSFWKEAKIFEKSVENRSPNNLYVFYDGPPFISGLPHYGHLLGSIAKDIIPRYWTMKGKRVERVWGWDAHGLTVENKVQKKLNIKNRRDIESFGLEKFTEACYEYTTEVSGEWGWYIDKIGRWVDMEHAYKTIDQSYMESVMWAFKKLYEKGLIYEGVRTSLYCPVCGTPVSNFEVAMDNSYKDYEDPAVTVKFPVKTAGEYQGANLLAWTTTPWTLPSNRALVLDDKGTYVLVESDGEKYLLAKPRLDFVFKDLSYKILKEINGSDLLGLEYEPPYRFFAAKEGEFKVYAFEGMVTMEDGTGIVHSAPGFGDIDTDMGKHYELTIMMTVDGEGKFLPGNNGKNPFEGMFYLKANNFIREDLNSRKVLLKDEKILHRVPFHDRCDTLLMQKAQNSWFIKLSGLKDDLVKNNEGINWVPSHLKEGRFKQGIEQAPDWCISRNRFWATPMPVWEAPDGERIVIGSVAELEELSGTKVKNLHRPYIDEIVINKNGKTFTRRPEVLDSWMEAGSMPYAQIHYPFENEEKFEKNFPGDYIVEYIAQVRAWFFVMHVLSTALFGRNSFKNVVTTGVMAGNDGRKMSKSFGNYTDPKKVIEDYGGDALRLYLMGSPLMVGENANFDDMELKTKLRNVVNPLWNSAKFFLMYAKSHHFTVGQLVVSDDILDQWILARLKQTIKEFSDNIEKYLIPNAVRPVENFVDDLSRWYVRRSRDRISSGDLKALSTLYTVLLESSKAFAPLIPFVTENIYQSIKEFGESKAESVHLCDYPAVLDPTAEELEIIVKMQTTRDVVSQALAIRTDKSLKVRQPLAALNVLSKTTELLEIYEDLVCDEVNVKKVELVTEIPSDMGTFVKVEDPKFDVYLDTHISESLELEGLAREMVRKLQDLRKEQGLMISDKIKATYENTPLNVKAVEVFGDEIKKKVLAVDLVAGSDFSVVKS